MSPAPTRHAGARGSFTGHLQHRLSHGGLAIAEQLKPRKISFLIERAAAPVGLMLLLAIAAAVAARVLDQPALPALEPGLLAAAGGLVLAAAVVLGDGLVAYRKEQYFFSERQIIREGGGILRDSHTELNVGNITHVQLILPWPRHPLFGVGHVLVDSAGSGERIRLRALGEPEAVYERVRALMRENGFSLACNERLHEEQPPGVAVLRELGGALATLAGLLIFGPPVTDALAMLPGRWSVVAPVTLLSLVFAGVVLRVTLGALDLRRRTYTVYDDAVVYTEGFLTRNNAFLPGENLADANTHRTVPARILGLYDVTLSCQGSGQQIVFRSLHHGPALSEALETLATRASARAAQATPEPVSHGASAPASSESAPPTPTEAEPSPPSAPGDEPAAAPATYRMHLPRALAPYGLAMVAGVMAVVAGGVIATVAEVPLLALIGGNAALAIVITVAIVGGAIQAVLTAMVTRFELGPRSVKRRYELLQTREIEYSNDKLTGVVYQRNPFDRWFDTCSIHFWSIGASEALVFAHVHRDDALLGEALRRGGMVEDRPLAKMPSVWSLRATAGESLPWLVLTVVGAPALLILALTMTAWAWLGLAGLGAFWGLVLVCEPIYYRRCRALFHPRHIEIRKGVLTRSRSYARYGNIRHVTSVRYPFNDRGRLAFQIAGHAAQTLVPLGFVDAIAARNEVLDQLLSGQVSADRLDALVDAHARQRETPAHRSRPALANTLAPLLGVSIVLFPLVALLPLTWPWAVLSVRRREYRIESYRVVARWGVIFRSQRSIVFEKIDHIQQARGLLNKLFNNGDIRIYTSGSTATDLTVRHIPDYRQFYEALHGRYTSDSHNAG